MFDGFHEARVPVGDAEIFALTGGAGPPLLLLHGRAGATVDADDDRADHASGRKIECPLLVLWGRQYLSAKAAATSPLEVWQRWADEVRDVGLDCGHFLAEEQPDACAEAIEGFFAGSLRG